MLRPALFLSTALALAAAGCGHSEDELPREPISGTVALDGKPLASGMITLTPTGAAEPVVSGIIRDGRFELERADGPVPGAHRVTIWSRVPSGKKVKDADNRGQFVDEVVDLVPPRYNLQSDLTADVTAAGPNAFEFQLRGARVAAGSRRTARR